jgi:hypothetical protein
MNAIKTIYGCPVMIRLKSNETYHGIFDKFSHNNNNNYSITRGTNESESESEEFRMKNNVVILECSHKLDPANETIVCGHSFPKKENVHRRIFKYENIVEITACEVDFALNCNFFYY